MAKTPFELDSFLPYLLNRAAEEISLAFQKHYRDRYGMRRTEWRILAHLGQHGPMTATQIGRQAHIHKTKISRAVVALEAKRFIERAPVEDDRRFEQLTLSAAGTRAFKDLSQIALAFDRTLEEQLGRTEIETLKALLTRLV